MNVNIKSDQAMHESSKKMQVLSLHTHTRGGRSVEVRVANMFTMQHKLFLDSHRLFIYLFAVSYIVEGEIKSENNILCNYIYYIILL